MAFSFLRSRDPRLANFETKPPRAGDEAVEKNEAVEKARNGLKQKSGPLVQGAPDMAPGWSRSAVYGPAGAKAATCSSQVPVLSDAVAA